MGRLSEASNLISKWNEVVTRQAEGEQAGSEVEPRQVQDNWTSPQQLLIPVQAVSKGAWGKRRLGPPERHKLKSIIATQFPTVP